MKVLINYPADADSEVIKDFLRSSVNLPSGPRISEDFRRTDTESISVVLFRTAMGVTEVDEVRDVLRLWARRPVRPGVDRPAALAAADQLRLRLPRHKGKPPG